VRFSDRELRPSPASLRVLNRSVDIRERLSALGTLSATPQTLYPTDAYLELTEFLLDHVQGLSKPRGFPMNGVHARVLLGAKGSGKTTLLRHFVEVTEVLFPDVVAVYVSCTDADHEHLLLPVARHLARVGIIRHDGDVDVALKENKLHELVLGSLEQSCRKLLLVVDELDQLYRCVPEDQEAYIPARRSLTSLACLGDVGGDVCAVLLCGSSAVLPLLITANGSRDDGIVREYPTVRGAPCLNGQKFRVLRLPGGLPTAMDTARVMRSSLAHQPVDGDDDGDGDDDDNEWRARLALFIAGGSPRMLEAALGSFSLKRMEVVIESSVSSQALSDRSKAFYNAVMTALRAENEHLMKAVSKDGTLSAELVASVEWETMFKSLSCKRLTQLWRKVCAEVPASDREDRQPLEPTLQSEVLRLCDKGFLAQDARNTDGGVPNAVFPVSAASLFRHGLETSDWERTVAAFDAHSSRLLEAVGEGASGAAGMKFVKAAASLRAPPLPSTSETQTALNA
jgi:hypothetical protein